MRKRRNGESNWRAPTNLVRPGGARSYMRDSKIEEDEDVMEGLLAADRVMALAQGRAPPGRNSRHDRHDYDASDYVTDLIAVGRAGGVAQRSAGSGRSDRKQRAITGISGAMEGHGASAFRTLCQHEGDISAKVARKNPRKSAAKPRRGGSSRANPSKRLEVEFFNRLPALVLVGLSYKRTSELQDQIPRILGEELPRLRIVVSGAAGYSASEIAGAIRAKSRGMK